MKKILFHINSLGKGGAERVVCVLAEQFVKEGYDVCIATEWQAKEEYSISDKIKRIPVGLTQEQEKAGRIKKIIFRFTNLKKCIAQEQPDAVVSFCSKANYRAAVAMLGNQIPLIVSVRNDPKIYYSGAANAVMNLIMQKRAKGCVFQTQDAMGFFSNDFQKRSTIIVNPLTESYLTTEKAKERDHRIVTAGRISSQKNQMLLCKAFAKICLDYPELELWIYGEVEEEEKKEEILHFIQENKLEERIRLCGSSNDIIRDLRTARMFVLPSDFEGMPNALMEAMAMKLPCIATDCPCGGSKMLITDAKEGYLTPVGEENTLAEAMKKMLDCPQKAEEMADNAGRKIREMADTKVVFQKWKAFIGV